MGIAFKRGLSKYPLFSTFRPAWPDDQVPGKPSGFTPTCKEHFSCIDTLTTVSGLVATHTFFFRFSPRNFGDLKWSKNLTCAYFFRWGFLTGCNKRIKTAGSSCFLCRRLEENEWILALIFFSRKFLQADDLEMVIWNHKSFSFWRWLYTPNHHLKRWLDP